MSKSRKNNGKVRRVHVDKHASKRPTHKDAWRNNDKTGDKVDVETMQVFLQGFNSRPASSKKASRR